MANLAIHFAEDPHIRVTKAIVPHTDCPAIDLALEVGLTVATVSYMPAESYADRLLEHLEDVEWICLAGYLRLLPIPVLSCFPNRILNIHPALLPKFAGKGMYGSHVHEAVKAAGETESGCTIHYVDEIYDHGQILLQERCQLDPEDTASDIAAKVLALEHHAYPKALRMAIERTTNPVHRDPS